LSLRNTSPKAISRVAMHLVYFGQTGDRLKDWTTRRDLEPPLLSNTSMQLDQPAFYMPFVTKSVKVEVESVRFSDGTEWTPPAS